MSTYDYELLDHPPAEYATGWLLRDDIDCYPAADIRAVMGWAQHEQNSEIYAMCYDALDRRAAHDQP